MKVACVGTVIKGRVNRIFDICMQSIKMQTFKDYDIFVCYSKEPFWLDDGIENPPVIEGVKFVEVENVGCMRFVEYPLRNLLDYDYVMIIGSDCTIPSYLLKLTTDYLEKTKGEVCGVIGKMMKPYGWEYNGNVKVPTKVDVISTVGFTFRPKVLLDAGVLNWKRDCPLASMGDEIWISGCLARKGIDRVVIPFNQFHIGAEKGNPLSVTQYSIKVGMAISMGTTLYFKEYWDGFKSENLGVKK
ncbi:hypothetical protein LCGC14_2888990 [marine sediment metagenome]|uniref:Uncharacterized protein n=1 Tax=marine sediment metagenome TaxID=412755 RepID=A0A0F8XY50_9ZZZZ